MKSYLSYIYGLLAVAFVAGCMKIDIQPIDDSAMASITLTSTDKVVTRADGVPEEDLNENDINSVQCFFYNTEDEILFTAYKDGLTVTDGFVDNLQFEISSADLSKLNETCSVYAIVNMGKQEIPTDKKISTLKKRAISLGGTHGMQDSFVMVGSANNLQNKDNKLTGEIKVKRVAAKVNVILNVASQIQMKDGDSTQIWMPHFSVEGTETNAAMSLTFIGDKSSTLAEIDSVKNFEVDAVSFVETKFKGIETSTEDKYTVTMAVPFYTYPKDLSDNEIITLQLPWKQVKEDGSEARWATYEYQIPLTNTGKALLSNHEYQLTVNVGVLGNLGNIDLTPSYVVTDWGTGEINAELSRPKYLVVDKGNHVIDGVTYHYVMNNETTLRIPYHTSDPCEISAHSCTQSHIMSTNTTQNPSFEDNADGSTNREYVVKIENGEIVVAHGLNNDLNDETEDTNGVFDFTPYIITLKIQHQGNSGFFEEVKIIQYPAVYGEAKDNSCGQDDPNKKYGYVFVNSNYVTGLTYSYWSGYVPEWSELDGVTCFAHASGTASSGGVDAKSMFVITATSLQGTKYIIGDPRETSPRIPENNPNDGGTSYSDVFTYAKAYSTYKDGSTNELTNYYPAKSDMTLTDQTKHETYNMIAPKFRICSGYGAIPSEHNGRRAYMDYMEARCASYQEDGYPAGRWRLPTMAELEFVNTLSNKGLIPQVFSNSLRYWSAHGYGIYSNTNKTFTPTHETSYSNSGYISVRCVYDEWYWGSEQIDNKEQFTWGDEPR